MVFSSYITERFKTHFKFHIIFILIDSFKTSDFLIYKITICYMFLNNPIEKGELKVVNYRRIDCELVSLRSS